MNSAVYTADCRYNVVPKIEFLWVSQIGFVPWKEAIQIKGTVDKS